MNGRQGGHPDIDSAVFDLHLDSAVLRQSSFRNIELRNNFHSCCKHTLHAFGQGFLRPEHTVYAVLHNDLLFLRINVNITGLLLNGRLNDLINQLDNRGALIMCFLLLILALQLG
ncbi:hypothetical protein D3C75_1008520 [compost metagenome]